MMHLINKLKEILFFILPVVYIAYIFYMRFILIRPPRPLDIPLTVLEIIIISLVILGLLVRIYFILKIRGILGQKETKNRFIIIIKEKMLTLSNMIAGVWISFLRVFTAKYWSVNHYILGLLRDILRKPVKNVLKIIICLEILPKMIIILVFLIDIFYFHKLFYFYKVLWLFMLPLVAMALRGTFRQYYEDNIEIMQSFIDVDLVPIEGTEAYTFSYKFSKNIQYLSSHIHSVGEFLDYYYNPICDIPHVLEIFDNVKFVYNIDWLFLSFLVLHVMGWSIILYYGICL